MEQVIVQLNKVPGILGSGIFSVGGFCLVNGFSSYDPMLWAEVIREMNGITAIYEALESLNPVQACCFSFDGGTVITRSLGDKILCALVEPNANLTVIGVAFQVAVMKLRDPTQPMASSHDRFQADPAGSMSRPELYGVEQGTRRGDSGASALLSWGSRTDWERGQSPDAAGREVMHHLLRTFAKYIGPQARFILEDELKRVNHNPMTLPATMLGGLIESAANRIASRSERLSLIHI